MRASRRRRRTASGALAVPGLSFGCIGNDGKAPAGHAVGHQFIGQRADFPGVPTGAHAGGHRESGWAYPQIKQASVWPAVRGDKQADIASAINLDVLERQSTHVEVWYHGIGRQGRKRDDGIATYESHRFSLDNELRDVEQRNEAECSRRNRGHANAQGYSGRSSPRER